jgi:DNA-binding protein
LFANGDDFSSETIEKNRNLYYQKQMANTISTQTTETMSLLTSTLNIHLNIGQDLTINSSSVFVSLATTTIESLSNRLIEQVGNAHIQIPSTFQINSTNDNSISLRVSLIELISTMFVLFCLVNGATTCFIW